MKRVLFLLTIFLSFIGIVSASSTGTVYCPDNDEPVNLRPSVTSPANNSLVCNSTVEVLDTMPVQIQVPVVQHRSIK